MSDETHKKGRDRPTKAPAPLRPLKRSPAELERLERLSNAAAAAVERMRHEQSNARLPQQNGENGDTLTAADEQALDKAWASITDEEMAASVEQTLREQHKPEKGK